MLSLQELIENGYVRRIETESTHIGAGYIIETKLHNYSIGEVTIRVGIDEYLNDAVTLINDMIDTDERITKKHSEERGRDENNKVRRATDEELKGLFND